MAASVPIFDVALYAANKIYFVRYSTSKQGQQIYYGDGVNGEKRIIHEVPGVDGYNQGYTPGQNVYNDWAARGIYFESVANWPTNYLTANSISLFRKNLP
jgi:hypothetical protein